VDAAAYGREEDMLELMDEGVNIDFIDENVRC
jgi:hypothetical protein